MEKRNIGDLRGNNVFMQLKTFIFGIIVLVSCTQCTHTRPHAHTPDIYPRFQQDTLTQSLFQAKDRTISEADIQRLLNGKINLPDTLRIAIYKYASTSINRYYSQYWNNEEYLALQQSYVDTLVAELHTHPRVAKLILIPTLMVSPSPTVTQLREAAVRLQADALLIFSVKSDIYYKSKLFEKNEAKAFATCETLLMDIRTGVIPHSSVITQENLVQKAEEDWSPQETRKRAENGAIWKCLEETGKEVVGYLGE